MSETFVDETSGIEYQEVEEPWWHAAVAGSSANGLDRPGLRTERSADSGHLRVLPGGWHGDAAGAGWDDRPPTVTWDLPVRRTMLRAKIRKAAKAHRTVITRVAASALMAALIATGAQALASSRHTHALQSQVAAKTAELTAASEQLAAMTARWQQAETNFKTATGNYATDEAQIAALSQEMAALQAQSPRYATPAP